MNDDYVVDWILVDRFKVKVMIDDCGCDWASLEEDCMPTYGLDLSNHRDYASPTCGDDMPISMEVAMDPEPEDKWDRMQFFKNYFVMPVYMYQHGGTTVNTSGFSCPWDSGMAGFVYVHKATFRKNWGFPKKGRTEEVAEAAENFLGAKVEELDAYMNGRVYGYVVEDEEGEELDSCWGYVGQSDYCLEEGKRVADWHVGQDRKQRLARVKELIRNHVPLELREQELRPQH